MTLDILALAFVVLFFIRGFFRGLIVAVCSVVALLLGVFVSLKLSQSLAAWMTEKGVGTGAWVPVLAYVILFIGVIIIVNMVARLMQKLLESMMLGLVNKVAGGVLYAVFSIFLWSILLWMGTRTGIITPETIQSSRTYNFLEPVAPWIFEHVGNLIPFVKNAFAGLQEFFDKVPAKPAEHVGTH
jgi:membrane protein required for colicin V production